VVSETGGSLSVGWRSDGQEGVPTRGAWGRVFREPGARGGDGVTASRLRKPRTYAPAAPPRTHRYDEWAITLMDPHLCSEVEAGLWSLFSHKRKHFLCSG
jgi:hypothetical protein